MRVQQLILKNHADIDGALVPLAAMAPDLVLVFGACAYFATPGLSAALRRQMPGAVIAGCSTAGEIAGKRVYDDSCDMADSHDTGERLAQALPQDGLTAVFMLGTGVAVNGSALIAGLQANLPQGVTISGGLAADAGAFRQTWTLGPRGATNNTVVAVGPYGDQLALLVSCVGRKLVMGDRVGEEVEAVANVLGGAACIAGFYANGEIGIAQPHGACQLHKQTMSVTVLSEA